MDIKHQQQQQIFPDGEWDFSRMFSMEELPDFTTGLLGHCVFPFENYEEKSNSSIPSAFFPNPEANNVQQSIDAANESSLFYFMSQENSNSSNFSQENTHFVSNSNHIDQATTDHYNSDPMDFCIMDQKNNTGSFMPVLLHEIAMSGITNNRNENLGTNHQQEANAVAIQEFQLKRKVDSEVNPSKNVKKKARVTRDVQKGKKSDEKLNKNQKLTTTQSSNDLEDQERSNVNGGAAEGLSSSSYCSEDDNASQDSNSDHSKIPETNSNSKKRASRGSATDPQSLYARKRRERINERLRILQNLVPNGTKVDISTMLEEAVHYVKFLKIQIKLLSSDDLWMYAPIAYNGMDIGLNHKIAMML